MGNQHGSKQRDITQELDLATHSAHTHPATASAKLRSGYSDRDLAAWKPAKSKKRRKNSFEFSQERPLEIPRREPIQVMGNVQLRPNEKRGTKTLSRQSAPGSLSSRTGNTLRLSSEGTLLSRPDVSQPHREEGVAGVGAAPPVVLVQRAGRPGGGSHSRAKSSGSLLDMMCRKDVIQPASQQSLVGSADTDGRVWIPMSHEDARRAGYNNPHTQATLKETSFRGGVTVRQARALYRSRQAHSSDNVNYRIIDAATNQECVILDEQRGKGWEGRDKGWEGRDKGWLQDSSKSDPQLPHQGKDKLSRSQSERQRKTKPLVDSPNGEQSTQAKLSTDKVDKETKPTGHKRRKSDKKKSAAKSEKKAKSSSKKDKSSKIPVRNKDVSDLDTLLDTGSVSSSVITVIAAGPSGEDATLPVTRGQGQHRAPEVPPQGEDTTLPVTRGQGQHRAPEVPAQGEDTTLPVTQGQGQHRAPEVPAQGEDTTLPVTRGQGQHRAPEVPPQGEDTTLPVTRGQGQHRAPEVPPQGEDTTLPVTRGQGQHRAPEVPAQGEDTTLPVTRGQGQHRAPEVPAQGEDTTLPVTRGQSQHRAPEVPAQGEDTTLPVTRGQGQHRAPEVPAQGDGRTEHPVLERTLLASHTATSSAGTPPPGSATYPEVVGLTTPVPPEMVSVSSPPCVQGQPPVKVSLCSQTQVPPHAAGPASQKTAPSSVTPLQASGLASTGGPPHGVPATAPQHSSAKTQAAQEWKLTPNDNDLTKMTSTSVPDSDGDLHITTSPSVPAQSDISIMSVPSVPAQSDISIMSVPSVPAQSDISIMSVPSVPAQSDISMMSVPSVPVSTALVSATVTCDQPITCDNYPDSCDRCPVPCDIHPVTCDNLPFTSYTHLSPSDPQPLTSDIPPITSDIAPLLSDTGSVPSDLPPSCPVPPMLTAAPAGSQETHGQVPNIVISTIFEDTVDSSQTVSPLRANDLRQLPQPLALGSRRCSAPEIRRGTNRLFPLTGDSVVGRRHARRATEYPVSSLATVQELQRTLAFRESVLQAWGVSSSSLHTSDEEDRDLGNYQGHQ